MISEFEKFLGVKEPLSDRSEEEEKRLDMIEENIHKALLAKFGERIYKDRLLSFVRTSIGRMIIDARKAAQKAEPNQYRGFKVGCSVVAMVNDHPEFSSGYNMKPREKGPKICAEQIALGTIVNRRRIQDEGKKQNDVKIMAIVVVGEAQKDAKSGLNPDTLRPCGNCRELVTSMLESTDTKLSDCILITVGLNEDKFELFTWDESLKEHGDLIDVGAGADNKTINL